MKFGCETGQVTGPWEDCGPSRRQGGQWGGGLDTGQEEVVDRVRPVSRRDRGPAQGFSALSATPTGRLQDPIYSVSIRIKFPTLWDSGDPVGDPHTSLPSSLELTVCAGDTDINQMSQK